MKKIYILSLTLVLFLKTNQINAQTEWTGPTITVSKANYADWTLPENQDILTANVALTRADNRGLFNIMQEVEFDNSSYTSPLDTEWAIGTIADGVGSLTFSDWDGAHGSDPSTILNVNVVLHLITDNIYIDTKLTSWTSGGAGGGFTYERSTDQTIGLNEFQLNEKIKLFPNPSSQFIQVSGLTNTIKFGIYNILGAEINQGTISNNEKIDIKNLTNGVYLLKFENGNTLKFIKK